MKKKSDDLVNYLWSRHAPAESDVILQQAKHLKLQFIKEGTDRYSAGVFFFIVLCLFKLLNLFVSSIAIKYSSCTFLMHATSIDAIIQNQDYINVV